MKSYPSIEYRIDGNINVYAFDKIDGSNIRAEWNVKNGFYKFGTRTRLLDPNESPLGEAVSLIQEKYSEYLSKIFHDNKYSRALAFFEFWGANSFAGSHEDEEHTVTLIDVNPYKKGILSAGKFIRMFRDNVEIPNIVFNGRVGPGFITAVRNGLVDGVTFEGVVCKGIKKKRPVMFKIKSREWIARVKKAYGHDKSLIKNLLDQTELAVNTLKSHQQRRFCPICFRSGSLSPICKCGSATLEVGYKVQSPRKNASKTQWRKFFQNWYPDLDFNAHWQEKK